MKRIYLIGAALVLLAIMTASYLLNSRRDLKTQGVGDASAAAPATETTPTPAVDNAPAKPVTDNDLAVAADCTPKKYSHVRRYRHARHGIVRENNKTQTKEYAQLIGTRVTEDNKPVAIFAKETSKAYLGNKPKAKREKTYATTYMKSDHLKTNINLGVELGFNQSGLADNTTSNIMTNSVYAGLLVNIPLSDHITFQPGVRYINKGNKTQSTMDVNTKEKLSLNYVEVPVNLIAKFGKIENARFFVGGGPYVSYLVSAKDKFQASSDGFVDVIGAQNGPAYHTGSLNKVDYGANAFIGAEIPEGLFFKAGGELGMRNIMENTSGAADRNFNFMVSCGYIIGGFRK